MTTSLQGPDQVKSNILVVDDEADICQMLAICLNKTRFNINYAGNAADAFTLMEQVSYDVVVTDVMMPGEDGVAFLGRVHEAWPEIPVILMTGHAHLQMAVNAIKNGAFDFVHKPIDFGHLNKLIDRAVNYTKLQRMEKSYRFELEESLTLRTAELKDATVELDFTKSALSKSASEKNEFMSTVSHEMRTPLNGVVGGLSLLEDEVTTAKGKEYIEIVRQSAENMVVLVDQLLTFGIGTGQYDKAGPPNLINLATNLNDVVTGFQPDFVKKGLSLTLDIAAYVPSLIWTDVEHFNRMIRILLGNALKFIENGAVTLEIFHSFSEEDGEMLHVSVTDTGIGIPGGLWTEHAPDGGRCFKFSMRF